MGPDRIQVNIQLPTRLTIPNFILDTFGLGTDWVLQSYLYIVSQATISERTIAAEIMKELFMITSLNVCVLTFK